MLTLKQRIQNLLFPLGSVQKIRRGYLKGYRIRLTENSLWSPILGRWEPTMQKIFVNTVTPGTIAYDLGANNGLHGLLLASLVGPVGKVFNFEPFPENITEIDENFKLNGISNYHNIQAAVSNKKDIIKFKKGNHAKQGHIENSNEKSEGSIFIETLTLDDFIEDGNPMPGFIKIDIEGAEADALDGFSKMISHCNPDMIIELHSPEQDRRVGKYLQDHGYKAYRFDPFSTLKFSQIMDYSEVYPHPNGIWGSIFCIGPGKSLENYSFDK